MASHYHPHPHHCQHQAPPPSTHCCCSPSHSCCTPPPPPPPPPQDHLLQAIASLLSQPQPIPTHLYPHHYPKSQTHNLLSQKYHPKHHHQQQQQQQQQEQTHSTITSLLYRIEALESSLNHHTHHSSFSLRDTAARIIQTHFRSFLVHRSRTLSHLKHLAFIKSTFNSLKKSSFSNDTHFDFSSLSHKAIDLLLKLDSIEDGDPMIRDGKRSISRDLIQFLDSIEGVAVKRHLLYVKAGKSARFGQKVNKSRGLDSGYGNLGGDDDKRKLLQNLRGRVENINRLCKVSANDDDEDVGDDDCGPNVLVSRRNGVSTTKNGVFVQRQSVQPRVKKSVRFAENGKISEVYSSTYEPDLSGDVTCLDGSSSGDDQGELLENVSCAVEDVMDSSQGAEDDEEALVDNGGSPHSSDGERNCRRYLKNDGTHKEKLLFSAPLPLKMENRADLMKSKGVRILTP